MPQFFNTTTRTGRLVHAAFVPHHGYRQLGYRLVGTLCGKGRNGRPTKDPVTCSRCRWWLDRYAGVR